MLSVTAGLARYVFICLTLWLVGRAVLRVLRVDDDRTRTWLLAPSIGMASWSVLLGVLVLLHLPLKTIAPWFWAGQVMLASGGAFVGWRHDRDSVPGRWWLLACLLLPIAVMMPNFLFGLANYPGSRVPEIWSYSAFSQYLWELPRGVDPGSLPLYRWGYALSSGRYIGPAVMGVLSLLWRPGDTQTTVALCEAVAIFCFSCAAAAFGLSRGLGPRASWLYLAVTVLAGWIVDLLWMTNLDNLLILAYGPALAVLAADIGHATIRRAIAMSLYAAAVIYTYPEFAAIVLIGTAAFVLESRLRTEPPARVLPKLAIGVALVSLVTAPFALDFVRFLRTQIDEGLQTGIYRPGEGLFSGLTTPGYRLAAFWALGAEQRIETLLTGQMIVASALCVLLACGVVRGVRERHFGVLTLVAVALLGTFWFAVKDPYSYGVYKFRVVTFWAVSFVTVSGARWLMARPWRVRPLVAVTTAIILLAIPFVTLTRVFADVTRQPRVSMARFRSVGQVATLIGGQPVGVFVDDQETELWALYYLRASRVQLGKRGPYLRLPRFAKVLGPHGELPWSRVRYLLTDTVQQGWFPEDQGWKPIWRSEVLTLWDTGSRGWATVVESRNPSALERVPERWLWLGSAPLQLAIISSRPASVALAAEFLPGPSVPGVPVRRVRVNCSAGLDQVVTIDSSVRAVEMPVVEGRNECSWTTLDAPVVRVQPNGDTRALILALKEPKLAWSRTTGGSW